MIWLLSGIQLLQMNRMIPERKLIHNLLKLMYMSSILIANEVFFYECLLGERYNYF